MTFSVLRPRISVTAEPEGRRVGHYREQVIPLEYRDFFTAAASTSGALIGLLFVAISVSQENAQRIETRLNFHTRASAALLVFSNALILSLAALVPGVSLGWWCLFGSLVIVAFGFATVRSGVEEWRRRRGDWRPFGVAGGLLAIAGIELYAGVRLIGGSSDQDAIDTVNYVVIADLVGGISRSWGLVQMRDTGLLSSLSILARGDERLATEERGERGERGRDGGDGGQRD
jgi:hypothetical protein